MNIHAFDFDGTLTTRDTLIEFIRHACGTRAFILGFLRHAPLLVLMKLHLYPNYRAKQRVFAHFFRGMSIDRFDALCADFARANRHLLRPGGIEALRSAINHGDTVVIVSASVDRWVAPFFDNIADIIPSYPSLPSTPSLPSIPSSPSLPSLPSSPSSPSLPSRFTILGTSVETSGGRLTGRFSTANCYGAEKVRRLLALYPDRATYRLTAYGDSRGDRELLAFADEAHYKPFRKE